MNEIMHELWKPITIIYQKQYQKAMKRSASMLYQALSSYVMPYYSSEKFNINYLVTCGCSQHIKKDVLTGCSMCSLHTEKHINEAQLMALRDKDKWLYAKLIKKMFLNSRGYINQRNAHEIFLSHSFFDDCEITNEVLEELFGRNPIFRKRPFVFEFETHVKDITQEKIDILHKYIGKAGIQVRMGIECKNEWLRKYWLNKDVTNDDVIKAIYLCHQNGIKVTANLLLGMPVLTEKQTISEFIDSVEWLDEHVDRFCVSFLNRTGLSLQNYIYKEMRDNEKLKENGIYHENHTGIPWLFTIINSLFLANQSVPSFHKRLTIGQFDPASNAKGAVTFYNKDTSCSCFHKTYDALHKFIFENDWSYIDKIFNELMADDCYEDYKALIKKQEISGDIQETVTLISSEIINNLWKCNTEMKKELEKEILILKKYNL